MFRTEPRSVEIVFEQLGIVVGHFFEVGDEPAFVHGVAMEAAGELVIDAATGHFFESSLGHSAEMLFCGLLVALKDEVDSGRVRKFWGAAKATVLDVEELGDGFDLGVDHAEIEIRAGTSEDFGLRDGVGERVGSTLEFGALVAVGVGDGEENAAKTGATHLVFGREMGAAKERFAIVEQKTGERPATLAGNRANGGLVAGVNVGALVAVDFYGERVFGDDLGDFGVLVAFSVDGVAPMAPEGSDLEKDRLVFRFGASESGVAPFVPVDGLVRGGAQVRTGGIFRAIEG